LNSAMWKFSWLRWGLPDGLFSNKIWVNILEGPRL
jgi:hypothetical protein